MAPDIQAIKQLPDDTQLTPTEAGRLLGMTSAGLIKKIEKKQLSAVRVAGRWFVLGKALKALITESTAVTNPLA